MGSELCAAVGTVEELMLAEISAWRILNHGTCRGYATWLSIPLLALGKPSFQHCSSKSVLRSSEAVQHSLVVCASRIRGGKTKNEMTSHADEFLVGAGSAPGFDSGCFASAPHLA
nr:hypothetical protein CFP56_48784 [Quercus suber]